MHPTKLALFRSIGSQWASVIFATAVKVFLLFFLARKLGPSSLAIFLYIQTIASLFAILQDGGFQILVFREQVTPSGKLGLTVESLISGYLGYLFGITVIGMMAVILLPVTFKTGFLLALFYFAFWCLTNMVSSLLKGKGAFEREALWRLQLNTLLALPVLLLIGLTAPSPEKVFLGLIIGQILILATKNGRDFFSRPKMALPPWRIWKTTLSFTVISGATLIYFKSSIILLKHLQPDLALAGQFGAAFQILEGLVILSTPVAQLAFRHMRLNWEDRATFDKLFGQLLIGATAAALLIAAACILFAPKVILLAYGRAYGPAAAILPLLIPALLFLLPNFILAQGIIALDGERYYAFAALLCAVFNVGLNLCLIPRHLAAGAAVSTVATEVLLTLLLGAWFIRRRQTRTASQGRLRKSEEEKKD